MSTCFLAIIFSILILFVCSKNNSIIYITVDNVLNDLRLNGQYVDISQASGNGDWTRTMTLQMQLNHGDVLNFHGVNWGGPAGLLITIIYYDINNKATHYNSSTGPGWVCDGTVPINYGVNGVGPWGTRPNIDTSALWIWNSNFYGYDCYCFFTIPCDQI